MHNRLIERLKTRFQSYHDLLASVDEDVIERELDVPRSKSLKVHLWCVVGAWESYTRGIDAGSWQGFESSLVAFDRASIISALETSAQGFEDVVARIEGWSEDRESLLLDLHEHEVMHEGQIIRLMYGLEQTLPKSWKWA